MLRRGRSVPPPDCCPVTIRRVRSRGSNAVSYTHLDVYKRQLFQREIDLNLKLIDEVWARYGHHESFQGWYLSQEMCIRDSR